MRVVLLFGGRSGEHEVSVMSAKSVFFALLDGGFDVLAVGITKEGRWVFIEEPRQVFEKGCTEVTADLGDPCYVLPDPSRSGLWIDGSGKGVPLESDLDECVLHAQGDRDVDVDVVFPLLHGSFGEDGTIQGLLDLSGLPYVGSGTLASSVCMDKDSAKMIMSYHGIPFVPYIKVDRWSFKKKRDEVLRGLWDRLTFPVFVKPSGSGSSLGVSKVKDACGLPEALDKAFLYDVKALIEPAQEGCLEIECAVLGNEDPKASVPGQIIPSREFYDYEAKYIDTSTRLVIPAPLDEDLTERVREISIATFRATGCSGLARVDMFVNTESKSVRVSEVNTMPGFTDVSMYPKLWEASGVPYSVLVEKLVYLALERKDALERRHWV